MPFPATDYRENPGNVWESYKPVGPGFQRTIRKNYDIQGHNLQKINWQGEEIIPVRKDFVVEHPLTEQRTKEECDNIRLKHSINIVNGTFEDAPKPVESFEEVPFPDWMVQALRQRRFQGPTDVQVQAWPVALKGWDLVAIAETGSGKTLAYVPPMLVHILAQPELSPGEGPVGIVLVPCRELCHQVKREIDFFCSMAPQGVGLACQEVYGGADLAGQASALLERVDIMVSTLGRLIHLLNDRKTNLRRATYLVLDEADELLQGGSEQQVRLVLSQVRPDRQVCLFSATWPEKVERLARDVCTIRPIHVSVGSTNLKACKTISQQFRLLDEGAGKLELLLQSMELIRQPLAQGSKCLVFCNRVETVPEVLEALKRSGYPAEGFYGASGQAVRDRLLARFQEPNGDLRLFVCTQLLGRGHDFENLKYVVNYDMPYSLVEYVHRIGRTGRAGQQGYSLTLLEAKDLWLARPLVQCLEETQQEVPDWLRRATRRFREYMNLKHQHRSANCPGAAEPWHGRGRGRRHLFLQRCRGRGAARGSGPAA